MPAPSRRTQHQSTRDSAGARARALARIRVLVAALSHSARAVERSTGVTNAQLFILQELAAAESLSVNDLASRARTQQSTVSIVVGRLVRAGLASKRRSSHDARLTEISLTARGRRLLAHAPAPPTAALLRAVERVSSAEARALDAGLRALLDALDLATPEVMMLFEHAPTRRSSPPRPARTDTRSKTRAP